MDPDAVRDVGRVPHGSSDDPSLLDFSANTNPLTPDGVTAVYEAALDRARSYPPEPATEFREAAAEYVGCDPTAVVPTPGGMAAIRLAIEVTVGPGDTVLVPAPSFGEYAREVRLQGAEPVFIAHDEFVAADPDGLAATDSDGIAAADSDGLAAADPDGHALAIVCTPNNPTGEAADPAALREFAARCGDAGTPLLVDEAFLDFADEPTLAGTDGVVVARSLTKVFGLPGLRGGFAVATADLRESLEAARRPWSVGTPALDVGTHCLRQRAFVEATHERVRTERDRMRESLEPAFAVHPSDAPFLLLDVGDRDVGALVAAVREEGIAIRDATTFRGLDSHVRVAVRLPEENDRLLEVLADV